MLTQEQLIKVTKIMGLSVLINDTGKYCTFVYFSGHVDSLKLQIRESKDDYQNEIADCELSLDLEDYSKYDSIDDRLDKVLLTMQALLSEDDIPYDYLHEVERIEYDYKF